MWAQREIVLDPRPRGFHLVTREVLGALPEIGEVAVGLLHLLIQHTSAFSFRAKDAEVGCCTC